jgi:hypothetical protein
VRGKLLNTIGLGLGAIGVVLIFIWGPPQPDFQDYVGLSLSQGTVLQDGRKVSDMIAETQRERERYKLMGAVRNEC